MSVVYPSYWHLWENHTCNIKEVFILVHGDRFPLPWYVFELICLRTTSLLSFRSHFSRQRRPTTTMLLQQFSELSFLWPSPYGFFWLVTWKFFVGNQLLPHHLDLMSFHARVLEFLHDGANVIAWILLQSVLDLGSDVFGDVVLKWPATNLWDFLGGFGDWCRFCDWCFRASTIPLLRHSNVMWNYNPNSPLKPKGLMQLFESGNLN